MIMLDGFSSYRTVAFLSSKSADIILKVFKSYQTEAERQTDKKMKQVRLDMDENGITQLGNNTERIKG